MSSTNQTPTLFEQRSEAASSQNFSSLPVLLISLQNNIDLARSGQLVWRVEALSSRSPRSSMMKFHAPYVCALEVPGPAPTQRASRVACNLVHWFQTSQDIRTQDQPKHPATALTRMTTLQLHKRLTRVNTRQLLQSCPNIPCGRATHAMQ